MCEKKIVAALLPCPSESRLSETTDCTKQKADAPAVLSQAELMTEVLMTIKRKCHILLL